MSPLTSGKARPGSPLAVYVAAPWEFKKYAGLVCRDLESAGFRITSRWVNFELPPGETEHTDAIKHEEAHNDIEDLVSSEVLLLLNLKKSEGKAWEQGYAVAMRLPVVGVGYPANCVFHWLGPDFYTWVPSVSAAIEILTKFTNGTL